MDEWIRKLIDSGVAGVRKLGEAAWERIAWLYNLIVTLGISARSAWGSLRSMVSYWRTYAIAQASETYLTLRYIILIRIPRIVDAKAAEILAWANRIAQDVEARATALITSVRNWAAAQINAALDALAKIRNFVTDRINEILDTLIRVRDVVWMLLTDPQRLAKWLFGALVTELLLFVDSNADRFLDLLRRKGTQYAGLVAARVEDVLARLL